MIFEINGSEKIKDPESVMATICSAKLILECQDRGLYPSWDAQNLWPVALTEKLGYHFDHAYTAYEITDY